MEHKALKYQMKTMISNFPDDILHPILSQLELVFKTSYKINIMLKSYKCYEASLMFKEKKITGYGRNEAEAFRICMKNFMEFLTENELYIEMLKTALSNIKNIGETVENDRKTPNKPIKPLEIDTTDTSALDNKALNHTKDEFGNISSINMIETPQNLCNSIMENDCLLVKMLNENPLHNIRYQDVSIEKNKNEFRKQKNNEKQKILSCKCNHEELLMRALKEISLLNNQISLLKNENETLRTFICNKENEDVFVKKEKKTKNKINNNSNSNVSYGSKKDDIEHYNTYKYNSNYNNNNVSPNINVNKNEEKNLINKLQMNLGLGLDKFKML